MYFKHSLRFNPKHDILCGYYRLVESYRNIDDRICHRTILNVGFLTDLTADDLNIIQKHLSNLAWGKPELFEEPNELISKYTAQFWNEIISKKRIDLPETTAAKNQNLVNIETIKHKEVREIGAEWLGFQALEQLKVKDFLIAKGWDEQKVELAISQIISRAVYPFSELRTSKWIQENSAICEVTGYPIEKITKDKLYRSALDLYEIKDALEQHLSRKTNELFDIEDKIILYDLTNTYFEGQKKNSKLAQFGRSKEKRSDAKLIVLALVTNPEGFIKYSNVFEGNTSDSVTLPTIIDNLRLKTSTTARALVVLDAGIATAANLSLLEIKGYDYLCVSRSKLKDYKPVLGSIAQSVQTKNKQILTLHNVTADNVTDYYLKVKSPGKTLKEQAMKTQFENRFEEQLEKIKIGLTKKHSTKRADKINQRIGRAIQKYPSTSKYYDVKVSTNKNNLATDIVYQKNQELHQAMLENLGVYFIRTNLKPKDEQTLWTIYNTIREIESTFRCLKTDLDLRPIYHKNDNATMAHLHLGILAYWLVNTIRYQLKVDKINLNWQEIVRIANTQKIITTYAKNQNGETVYVRRCSEPNQNIKSIYQALKFKPYPFVKRKSVVHSSELKKNNLHNYKAFEDG
jgi:Transposase DDE domain